MVLLNKTHLLLGMLVLGACSGIENHTQLIERSGLATIQTRPGIKASLIKNPGSQELYCAPREADFAETEKSGFSLGASNKVSGESVAGESGQGALSLGGRDPAVLILRELTYRACEFNANYNANPAQAKKVYDDFLALAEKMMRDAKKGQFTRVRGLSAGPSDIPQAPREEPVEAENATSQKCDSHNLDEEGRPC
ncbi:MAG: hypothetical protein ACPGVK_02890 [Halocynthiibacter sp.]